MLRYISLLLFILLSGSSLYLFKANKSLNTQLNELETQKLTVTLPPQTEEDGTLVKGLIQNVVKNDSPFGATLVLVDNPPLGCNTDHCYFKRLNPGQYENKYFGYTTLTGYYSTAEVDAYGEKVVCDFFNVQYNKPDLIIDSLLTEYDWIEQDSTNTIRFAINLNQRYDSKLEHGITKLEKEVIMNSTAVKQVKITVSRNFPAALGTQPCEGLFNIIGVK